MAIYKGGRGFELGPTENKSSQRLGDLRAELELGASRLQVQRSNRSATLPPQRKSRNIPVLSIRVDLLRKQALLSEPHQDMDS